MSVSAFHRNHVIHHLHGDTFSSFYWKIIYTQSAYIIIIHPHAIFLCSWSYHSVCRRASLPFSPSGLGVLCDNHSNSCAVQPFRELLFTQQARGTVTGERWMSRGSVSKVLLPPLALTRLGLWAPGRQLLFVSKHPEDSSLSSWV